MKRSNTIGKKALALTREILAQPEFAGLTPLGHRAKLVKCNAGSFIPLNYICYGEHSDIRCERCKYKARKGG